MDFKKKVLKIVAKIPEREFLSYQAVARRAGKKSAQRAVAQVLARNRNKKIPCHRVIRKDREVGGYFGKRHLSWKKAALLLKEGAVGVVLTDTLYGICASAFVKKSVEKVYHLKKRSPDKPFIILISDLKDLERFGIKTSKRQKEILQKIWPSKISAVLKCLSRKFFYLHRGRKSLAFRLPRNRLISKILKISGPLIAPSANLEGKEPAKSIREAKKYFKDKVFYLDSGFSQSKPSTLIDLREGKIEILRKGCQIEKVNRLSNS